MNGISFGMVFGALVEMALAHATLIIAILVVFAVEVIALVLRARQGEVRFGLALRWSIGLGIVGIVVIGYGLLMLTKSGFGDLHGWVDYAAWLLPTIGLATGLAVAALPGFAALSVRR
ncbi:MAG: hypothetical protein ACK4GK_02520 [Ferrovibrio sp.]|jgi:hypothetical protein